MLALAAATVFDYGRRGPQLGVDQPWAGSIGLRFHLGVDGISLPLIVLTAAADVPVHGLHGAGAAPQRGRPAPRRHAALVGLVLLLEVGMLGTFVSLDLVLFFVFFEVVLIPMYFVIAHWGGSPGRASVRGRRRTSSSSTRCSAPASCSSASCSSRSTPVRST